MEKTTLRTAGLSLAVALFASVGLSGCVTVQPEDEAPTPSAVENSPSTESVAPTTQSDEASPSPTTQSSPSAQPSSAANFDSIFASIADAADKKLECLDDDDTNGRDDADDLTISDSDIVISITGDCDDVLVTGNNLTIAIVEVDDLTVRGNNNMIAVQDLDDVDVTGSQNIVSWNPVHEDDPDVDDKGSDNVLRHDALLSADLNL